MKKLKQSASREIKHGRWRRLWGEYKDWGVNTGSRKNKFAIFSVEALTWQGAKAQEYQAYSELSQRSQAGCIGA